jgi:hypothetical protein
MRMRMRNSPNRDETTVLAFNGLAKVLKANLATAMALPGFNDKWDDVCRIAARSLGCGRRSVAVAAAQLLTGILQVSGNARGGCAEPAAACVMRCAGALRVPRRLLRHAWHAADCTALVRCHCRLRSCRVTSRSRRRPPLPPPLRPPPPCCQRPLPAVVAAAASWRQPAAATCTCGSARWLPRMRP